MEGETTLQGRVGRVRTMRGIGIPILAAWVAVGLTVAPGDLVAQDLTARVWVDRGAEPVLERGQTARIYYRTSRDAYVAIFRMDTNGGVHLLHPRGPNQPHRVRGGRDYRLVTGRGSQWLVDEDPGVGYHFIVASPWPLDFSRFHHASYAGGWDLGRVARSVYGDPYVAMDDFVMTVVPGWEYEPYALDFSTYHVGDRYEYPRFLCYDCHGFQTWRSWNPYHASCSSFQIVIYDDPWYYPANRYRGERVVYVRPPLFRQPRYVFKEAPYGVRNDPVRQARPRGTVVAPSPRPNSVDPRPAPSRGTLGGASAAPTRRPAELRPRESPRSRPTAVIPRRGGSEEGARGSTGSVRPPTSRSGGSVGIPSRGGRGSAGSGTARPPTRSGGASSGTARPPARSGGVPARGSVGTPARGGSSGTARPPARSSGGSSGTARPPARSGGASSGTARPPARSSGGASGTARPPARSGGVPARGSVGAPTRGGSSGTARPPTRSSGGGAAGSTRPPTRRGGGGGGPF